MAAGSLWLPTMLWLGTVPWRIRDAHLDQLATDEGRVWGFLGLTLVTIGALLTVANWLSVLAHGDRHTAARTVVVVRVASWAAFVTLLLMAIWIESTWGRECWRTCAPFPN
jgi:hypothetical protein